VSFAQELVLIDLDSSLNDSLAVRLQVIKSEYVGYLSIRRKGVLSQRKRVILFAKWLLLGLDVSSRCVAGFKCRHLWLVKYQNNCSDNVESKVVANSIL
jgi:hypothetical protein